MWLGFLHSEDLSVTPWAFSSPPVLVCILLSFKLQVSLLYKCPSHFQTSEVMLQNSQEFSPFSHDWWQLADLLKDLKTFCLSNTTLCFPSLSYLHTGTEEVVITPRIPDWGGSVETWGLQTSGIQGCLHAVWGTSFSPKLICWFHQVPSRTFLGFLTGKKQFCIQFLQGFLNPKSCLSFFLLVLKDCSVFSLLQQDNCSFPFKLFWCSLVPSLALLYP